jgi:hypothetical protein
MAATPWEPSEDEVRRIVAELRPVIDECVRRSRRELAAAALAGADAGHLGAA